MENVGINKKEKKLEN